MLAQDFPPRHATAATSHPLRSWSTHSLHRRNSTLNRRSRRIHPALSIVRSLGASRERNPTYASGKFGRSASPLFGPVVIESKLVWSLGAHIVGRAYPLPTVREAA